MADTTISIGWKISNAAGGMKQIIMSAEDLRKVMKLAVEESKRLSDQIFSFAAVCTTIDSLAGSVDSLKSVVDDFAAAYDIQESAETRLAQVMHNTMDAREEDIQSIKDFCSAQQQIGVVGDEVQLAGAQELASYLELKSSLRSLIPVMNDMLVQQNGLSSTGENAAQVASMLGKVMEGQTGALSRYGYRFDAAQEQILKYGTEAEKVKVLVEVVSASVGGMNEAMARTPSGRMQQIANNLGDMKEQIGGLVKGAQPLLAIGANATVALSGVMKLTKGLKALTATLKLTQAAAGWIGLALMAVVTAAIWVMNSTDDATDSLEKFKDEEERAAEAAQRLADTEEIGSNARRNAISSLELYKTKIEIFNGTKEEEQKLVKELNSTYGTTMGYFKSLSDWYNALVKNSQAYCDQMVAEAKARKYADQIADLEIEREKITDDGKGGKRKYSKKPNERTYRAITDEEAKAEKAKGNRVDGQHVAGKYVQWAWMDVEGTSDLDKAQAAYDDYTEQIINIKAKAKEISGKIEMSVMGDSTPPEDVKPMKSVKSSLEKEVAPEGSIRNVRDQISDIEKKISFSIDPDEIFKLQREKLNLQEKIKELELPIRIAESKEKIAEMLEDIHPEAIKIEVDTSELTQTIQEIPKGLTSAEKLQQTLGTVSNVAGAAGQAFKGMGEAFEMPALDVMGIIAGAIATMVQGFAQASMQASTLGPWAWAAFGLTGLAQLTAMITQIKSVTAFADGGIVSGPTLGLIGEYAGARSNPEVVAPLSKLRDIIGTGGASAPVIIGGRLELSGRDLAVVLENQSRIAGLSGRNYRH